MTAQHDIRHRDDIVRLVNTFYQRVREDDLIGPIFKEQIGNNWDHHLSTMHDFWFTLLFSQEAYRGHPFAKHIGLPINTSHFERWLLLFNQTLDELFQGERAMLAKKKAANIAQIFQARLGLTGGWLSPDRP
jgi:hemoglobin